MTTRSEHTQGLEIQKFGWPAWLRWSMSAFGCLWMVFGLAPIAGITYNLAFGVPDWGPWWPFLASFLMFEAIGISSLRYARVGLEASGEGLLVRNILHTREFRWPEIAGIEDRSAWYAIRLRAGGVHLAWPVGQNALVSTRRSRAAVISAIEQMMLDPRAGSGFPVGMVSPIAESNA